LTTGGNAICERAIGTLRREVLDRLLIVNEHHLRQVLTEYLRHYNTGRPHRALGQLTPAQADTQPPEPINLAGTVSSGNKSSADSRTSITSPPYRRLPRQVTNPNRVSEPHRVIWSPFHSGLWPRFPGDTP